MLIHDITNNKYYYNCVEITAEEYAELYAEWEKNRPPAPVPVDDVDDTEALTILLGGEAE